MAETHSLGEGITVPAKLRSGNGVARVYAAFRRLRGSSMGPGALAPGGKIVLQGDGEGQTEAAVALTGKIPEDSTPGDYLCVALHVCDSQGHLETIETPNPSKVLRVV